jgi:hypothetical protein
MTRMPAIALALTALATPLASSAAPPCTQETLTVQGTPVTIGYCIDGPPRPAGGQELLVPVAASYVGRGASLRRAEELHFLSGEGVSRVIENLDLSKVGLTGMLHLTLAYSHGLVRIEGALLTPGAITIK